MDISKGVASVGWLGVVGEEFSLMKHFQWVYWWKSMSCHMCLRPLLCLSVCKNMGACVDARANREGGHREQNGEGIFWGLEEVFATISHVLSVVEFQCLGYVRF